MNPIAAGAPERLGSWRATFAVMYARLTTVTRLLLATPLLFAALISCSFLDGLPQPNHGVAFVLMLAGIMVSSRR